MSTGWSSTRQRWRSSAPTTLSSRCRFGTTQPTSTSTQTTVLGRFCSSDLAEPSAFYNPESGLGSNVRIYLTGEETGPEGRGFATFVTGDQAGTAFELPYLGNLSYENLVASPLAQDKTIVVALDDGLNGQVYIYVGDKQTAGTEIEKAGLSSGSFYGIKVDGIVNETNGAPANGTFTLQEIGDNGDVSNLTGAAIDADSEAQSVTELPPSGGWRLGSGQPQRLLLHDHEQL